ncbi:MAG: fibronectin type III domain-containing protein, partial [Actinomycetota bacterium]
QTEAPTVRSLGIWAGADCNEGYKQYETIHCDGWVDYQDTHGTTIGGPSEPDTSAPGNVPWEIGEATHDSISLGWGPAYDDRGVVGYRVSVDGAPVAQLGATSRGHTVTGLSRATLYDISVQAFDAAGNVGPSPTITAGTLESPPLPRLDFAQSALTSTSITVEWSDVVVPVDAPIEAVGVFVDDSAVAWLDPEQTAWTITGLQPNTTYQVGVYPVRLDYNTGERSIDVAMTTSRGDQPPAEPPIQVFERTDTSITVQWGYLSDGGASLADDTVDVTYRLLMNGEPVALANDEARSYTASGLFPSTTYTFQAIAIDLDGNASPGPELTAETKAKTLVADPAPPADTVAPLWGSGVEAAHIVVDHHRATSVDISWCCALDYDQFQLIPASFDVYARIQGVGSWELVQTVAATDSSGSATISTLGGSPLVTWQNYSVRVVAIDEAGNRSRALERHGVQPRDVLDRPDVGEGDEAPDPEPHKNPPPPGPGDVGPPVPDISVPEIVPPSDVVRVDTRPFTWDCDNATFLKIESSDRVVITWESVPDGVISFRGVARNVVGEVVDRRSTSREGKALHFLGLDHSSSYAFTIDALGLGEADIGTCRITANTTTPPPDADPDPGDIDDWEFPEIPADAASIAVCVEVGFAFIIGGANGNCYIYAAGVLYSARVHAATAGFALDCDSLNILSCGRVTAVEVRTANTDDIEHWGLELRCQGSSTKVCSAIDGPSWLRFTHRSVLGDGFISPNWTIDGVRWQSSRHKPRGWELRLAHQAFCDYAPPGSYPSWWCDEPDVPEGHVEFDWSCSNPHIDTWTHLDQSEPADFEVLVFRDADFANAQILEFRVREDYSPYYLRFDRPWPEEPAPGLLGGGVARIVLRAKDLYGNGHVLSSTVIPFVPECYE